MSISYPTNEIFAKIKKFQKNKNIYSDPKIFVENMIQVNHYYGFHLLGIFVKRIRRMLHKNVFIMNYSILSEFFSKNCKNLSKSSTVFKRP